jgi:CheY-like chemotaxis protein
MQVTQQKAGRWNLKRPPSPDPIRERAGFKCLKEHKSICHHSAHTVVSLIQKRVVGKASMGKKRILLIEDDRSLQVALRYMLEDLGYELVVAEDHAGARVAMDDGPYDIAIVDYFLGNMPSSDLIAELRRRYPRTPLICSTAAFAEQVKLDNESIRPNAFLYKPFGAKELRDTLNSLLAT